MQYLLLLSSVFCCLPSAFYLHLLPSLSPSPSPTPSPSPSAFVFCLLSFAFFFTFTFCLLSSVFGLLSTVFYLLSSAIYLHLHIGLLLLSSVFCLPSSVFRLLSYVTVCESNILILGKSNHRRKYKLARDKYRDHFAAGLPAEKMGHVTQFFQPHFTR